MSRNAVLPNYAIKVTNKFSTKPFFKHFNVGKLAHLETTSISLPLKQPMTPTNS